jgi:NAD(P)-dependent dehydrogenase (short-subunit alcohol dehydrogenase family)
MDFIGQHVVITGGSTGIGRATAEKIVKAGGKVTLIARRPEVLETAARAMGPNASWIAADTGEKEALIAALDGAEAVHGPIDGLFLNAAVNGAFSLTPDYGDEAFEEVMRINAFSLFWAVRHVLPGMIARGKGAILVTGSLGGETGMVGNIGYCASKHAAVGIARTIAMEGAAQGIRCNWIAPGFIDTEMLANVPEAFKAQMARRVPQKRVGTAEEAGAVAAFLLSDDASHVTAQGLAVDGGLLGTLVIEQ